MANKVSVKLKGDKELMAMLQKLPIMVAGAGIPAAERAGAIIAGRARQLAPRSDRTGSRQKQSKSTKAGWGTDAQGNAANPLRDQIKTKVIKYRTAVHAVVGPTSPKGNQAHFQQTKTRRHVMWGKFSSVSGYRIARDWIVQAFDETRSLQNAAIVSSLRQEIDSIMKL